MRSTTLRTQPGTWQGSGGDFWLLWVLESRSCWPFQCCPRPSVTLDKWHRPSEPPAGWDDYIHPGRLCTSHEISYENCPTLSRTSVKGSYSEMSAEMGFGLTSVLTGNETLLDSNVLLEINCFLLIHGYYFNQNEMSYLKAND